MGLLPFLVSFHLGTKTCLTFAINVVLFGMSFSLKRLLVKGSGTTSSDRYSQAEQWRRGGVQASYRSDLRLVSGCGDVHRAPGSKDAPTRRHVYRQLESTL